MKRIVVGTALTVLAFAPAMSWADCDGHDKAAMASTKPAKADAQATAANKAAAPVVAKTPAKQVKQAASKPTPSTTKTDGSTVMAKTN